MYKCQRTLCMSKPHNHKLWGWKPRMCLCRSFASHYLMLVGMRVPLCFYSVHHSNSSCLMMPHTHCGVCYHFLPAVYSHNFLQHPITHFPDDLTATVSRTTSSGASDRSKLLSSVCWVCVCHTVVGLRKCEQTTAFCKRPNVLTAALTSEKKGVAIDFLEVGWTHKTALATVCMLERNEVATLQWS